MRAIPVERLVRPPGVVEFTEHRVFGAVPVGSARVRQTWTALPDDGGRRVWEVVEHELVAEGPRWRESIRVALGPDGYVQLGATPRSGPFIAWEPPCVVLPAVVSPGALARVIHRKGDREVERSVEIAESALFEGAIVAISDVAGGPTRIVMRDHFLPDLGWVGFEGILLRPNGQMRIWSDDVVIDGAPAPRPPEEPDAE